MVNTFVRLRKLTVGVGISKRFGIGFCIDKWSVSVDFGPAWVYIEW